MDTKTNLPASQSAGPFQTRRAARIVVADDDETTRALVRILLAEVPGLTVVGEAGDGVAAVELVMEHEPEIALLDVHMPRLDGIDAAELIWRARPETHVILHTNDSDPTLRERALRGGWTLLVKNDFDESVAAVQTWLDRRRSSIEHLLDLSDIVCLAVAEGYRLAATRMTLQRSAA